MCYRLKHIDDDNNDDEPQQQPQQQNLMQFTRSYFLSCIQWSEKMYGIENCFRIRFIWSTNPNMTLNRCSSDTRSTTRIIRIMLCVCVVFSMSSIEYMNTYRYYDGIINITISKSSCQLEFNLPCKSCVNLPLTLLLIAMCICIVCKIYWAIFVSV